MSKDAAPNILTTLFGSAAEFKNKFARAFRDCVNEQGLTADEINQALSTIDLSLDNFSDSNAPNLTTNMITRAALHLSINIDVILEHMEEVKQAGGMSAFVLRNRAIIEADMKKHDARIFTPIPVSAEATLAPHLIVTLMEELEAPSPS